jgi:protein TonB
VAGPAATEAPAAASARPATAAPHPAVEVARADHRHCPAASHPRALRERGIEGAVRLAVRISAEGAPADVRVVEGSGWRLFDEAALAQARGCRFVPARRDGIAVESWVQFRVRFALAGPADGFAPLALTQPEREQP